MHSKLKPLGIEQVKPKGWLLDQLLIQADGLSKKLFEVWDSTGSYSGWLGGTGEDWERGPYYIDGVLPLAYYTGDLELNRIADSFISWTLNSQNSNGNFGPQNTQNDWWSRTVMLKAIVQYYEISHDDKVLDFMERYFVFMDQAVDSNPFTQWGAARTADTIYCILRLDGWRPLKCRDSLLQKIVSQSLDWDDIFSNFPFTRPAGFYYNWAELMQSAKERIPALMQYHATHIVNITQGTKFPAVLYWLYGDITCVENLRTGIEQLTRYHGVVTGIFNGDEHLSGANPTQGAELCSIVEYMFSLEIILEILGDPAYADLLERVTYNALPATITEDFMGHQYLQQVNQIEVTNEHRNWFNNNDDSTIYGLEPNFGCCTANMHQGWPKLVRGLWYAGEDDELIAMAYAPSEVTIGSTTVEEETHYPFRDRILFTIKNGRKLKLRLRVPGWCHSPRVLLNGAEIHARVEGGFITCTHQWGVRDSVELILPMEVKISRWYNNSAGIERGPLVYALDMQEDWEAVRTVCGISDYQVTSSSCWNFAIASSENIVVKENELSKIPFAKEFPPVELEVEAIILEGWMKNQGNTEEIPRSPVTAVSSERKSIRLIPYGCTKLRIGQFPTLF